MSGPFGSSQWMYNSGGGFYDYSIDDSLRFNDNDSAYLNRTPASTGNRKTWTYSCWFKRGNLGIDINFFNPDNGGNESQLKIRSDNKIQLYDSGGLPLNCVTDAVFRDTSAWYHLVVRVDTTQATGSDRVRIYINNELQSVTNAGYGTTTPSQNYDTEWNLNCLHTIGRAAYAASGYFDGYMAEINHVDGQSLAPTEFGEEKSGVWIPKDTSGLTFGTNGFHLEFAGNANDTSGNGNNWTANNISSGDYVLDSPTNNFSVLKIAGAPAASGAVMSQGNLKCQSAAGISARNMERCFTSTLLLKAGFKWYVEHYVTDTDFAFGLSPEQSGKIAYNSNNSRYCLIYATGGAVMNFQSFTGVFGNNDSTNVVSTGDVVGMFVDMTVTPPKVTWSLNGLWGDGSAANQSNPTSFITLSSDFTSTDTDNPGDLVVWVNSIAGGQATSSILNFGQDSTFAGSISAGGNTDANGRGDFKYSVPSDGLALCSANLPAPAFDPLEDETPEDYFNTVLYTGNSSTQNVTGVGFQPDLIWIKNRSATYTHQILDVVRGKIGGASSYARLRSDTTAAQATPGGDDGLTTIGSDGFTVLGDESYNNSGNNFVAWNWKAGGTGVSNTDGSITTTVSTNTDAGFSIIKYTGNGTNGATIGHGLGATPGHIIIKRYSSSEAWVNWNTNFSGTQYLRLYQTTAVDTATTLFNSTLPNSSVITLGTGGFTNTSSEDYICYAFAGKEGFSKFGSYIGNSSNDGAFVYTGFRPAWIMIKRTDSTNNWYIFNNKTIPYNSGNAEAIIKANLTDAESDSLKIDFLSNGFKPRDASPGFNTGTYIYLAFAEQPFKYANAR